MKRLFALLLALLLPCAALAQEAPATLSATGNARVSVTPDIVALTFGLSGSAITVSEAQGVVDGKLGALYDALSQSGVQSDAAYTARYGVNTVYSYQYGKLGEGESPSGYSVACDVTVRLTDVTKMGAVIDGALKSGADSSYELSFESSRANEAYDRALTLAVANAMEKAAVLAKAAGVTLRELISVKETDGGAAPGARESMADNAPADGPRYLMGVDAAAEVVYAIAE